MQQFIEQSSPKLARSAPRWRLVAAVCALMHFSLTGCGGDDGKVDLYPVTGAVTYRGKPIEGAELFFFTDDSVLQKKRVPAPRGVTDAQGKFELTTYEDGDGAPASEYRVAITWMKVTKPSDDPEEESRQDRLAGRYANPDSSGLVATVEESSTELAPFELK